MVVSNTNVMDGGGIIFVASFPLKASERLKFAWRKYLYGRDRKIGCFCAITNSMYSLKHFSFVI